MERDIKKVNGTSCLKTSAAITENGERNRIWKICSRYFASRDGALLPWGGNGDVGR